MIYHEANSFMDISKNYISNNAQDRIVLWIELNFYCPNNDNFLCKVVYNSKMTKPTLPAFTCSKVAIETLEQGLKYVRRQCCSGVFIVKLEHISHHTLVFLLLTLNM